MTEDATPRQPKIGTATYALAAASALMLVVFLGLREDWQPLLLGGLIVLVIGLAPLSIERDEGSINGSMAAIIIAACVLGPSQAACVGLLGWLAETAWYVHTERRHNNHVTLRVRAQLNNVLVYSLFPIATGVVGRHVDLDHGLPIFVGLVGLAYIAGFVVNIALTSVFSWSEDGVPVVSSLQLSSTLLAEMVAAQISAFGVYLVLKGGAPGLAVAAVNLLVFMGLVGKFYESIDNRAKAEEKQVEAEQHRDEAERLRVLAEDRLAQIAYGYRLQVVGTLEALQAKDRSTGRHSAAVSALLREFARYRGATEAEIEFATVLGLVHDIGKLEVPERTLTKPGRLTRWEMALVREHSEDGAYYVRNLKGGAEMARIIVSHHERWDGGDPQRFWKMGYPDGLKGDEIPELSCMITVVDTYEAITNRNFAGFYRTHEEALQILREEKGRQFRADLVDEFIALLESRPDLRFNVDRGETFKAELERFLGAPPPGYGQQDHPAAA